MGGGRGGISKATNGAGAVAAAVGLQSIPAGSRKVVQSLKEIVNCPEPEIYAMLKECNMDPNEAVNRLLTQDPFREVKSKREKKKENKETPEIRSRGGSGTSNRGRGSADRYANRGGSTQYVSSESLSHSRPVYKKDNGYSSSLPSVSGVVDNSANRRPPLYSDAAASEVKVPATVMHDNAFSGSQPSGYQGAWGGVPGQVSMADIVKMGRPQNKVPSAPNTSHSANHKQGPSSGAYQSLQFPEDQSSKVSDDHLDARVSSGQHVDEWPTIEQPSATSMPSVYRPPAVSAPHPESPNIPLDTVNRHSSLDEVQTMDDGTVEDHDVNHLGATSVSGRNMEDNAEGEYLFENDMYHNKGPYQPKSHKFDHQGDNTSVSVSSVTANIQQLNLKKEDAAIPLERDGPSVVMPDHLQFQSAACSHLSFGTFGSSPAAPFSGPLTSMPVKANLEEAPLEADGSSVGPSEARNAEYYADEPLRNTVEDDIYHRAGGTTGSYDSPPASQPEPLKVENLEVDRGNQYAFPSSTPGYAFDSSQQLNIGFSESQTSSQMQNLSPFSNVMPAYTNSLPNSLLAANVNPGRETDLPYSPFAAQSMAAKYGNIVSSIGGPSISMNEALKAGGGGGLSSTQPTAQTMSGNNVAAGPVPQHLAAPQYSQPALPLGPFAANMISYPYLPQYNTYVPSGYQQTFAGNNTYHQSIAAMLPQYKNSVSVSSLPQSAAVASGYASFGNSTAMPGNFQMNPAAAAPSGTNISYDDVLNAQYKDNSHLISLQQSENSGMWLHGPGSRTMSAVPANTYYNFQGQSQQPSGFRQGQQPSQNYGALGYPNFYHSQTGMSLEHQQQNPRDGSLGGSQGQPKPSQQLWPNY